MLLKKKLKWMRAVGKTNEGRQRQALTWSVSEDESENMPPDGKWATAFAAISSKSIHIISDTIFLSKYGNKASVDWR